LWCVCRGAYYINIEAVKNNKIVITQAAVYHEQMHVKKKRHGSEGDVDQ